MRKLLFFVLLTTIFVSCKKEQTDKKPLKIEVTGDAFDYEVNSIGLNISGATIRGEDYDKISGNSTGGVRRDFGLKEFPATSGETIKIFFKAFMYNGKVTPVKVKVMYNGSVLFEGTKDEIEKSIVLPN